MMNYSQIILETRGLTKVYENKFGVSVAAVSDVSIEVNNNEVLLISGPNGSGKTTLLSMLGCLLKPSAGKLKIAGQDVSSLDQNKLAGFRLHQIGFIFQAFRLLDSLTVIENVELVLNLAGIHRPVSYQKAGALLEELKITHRGEFFPNVLSGGEKQRVAIARALVSDPAIILADEPTGSLDSRAGQAAIELLCTAAKQRNKAVIIVSHDERIQHYAHRVLHMEDGQIN